jgi:hypothetical protein
MKAPPLFTLVIYNFEPCPTHQRATLRRVEEGDDIRGLNVVFCDPSPADLALTGSQWAIELCHRIISRAADSRMFKLPNREEAARLRRNSDLRHTFQRHGESNEETFLRQERS